MIIQPSDIPIDNDRILELKQELEKYVDEYFDMLPCNDKGEIFTHKTYGGKLSSSDELGKQYAEYRDKYLLLHCINGFNELTNAVISFLAKDTSACAHNKNLTYDETCRWCSARELVRKYRPEAIHKTQ